MALDLVAKVFPPVACSEAEECLNTWLAAHRGIEVAFITQSGHSVGDALLLTLTLLYTEPTERDLALQARMRSEDEAR